MLLCKEAIKTYIRTIWKQTELKLTVVQYILLKLADLPVTQGVPTIGKNAFNKCGMCHPILGGWILDTFFKAFEHYAQTLEWPEYWWVLFLSGVRLWRLAYAYTTSGPHHEASVTSCFENIRIPCLLVALAVSRAQEQSYVSYMVEEDNTMFCRASNNVCA